MSPSGGHELVETRREVDAVYVERAAAVVKRAAGLPEDTKLLASRWVFDVQDLVAAIAVELESSQRSVVSRRRERCLCGAYPCSCEWNYPERGRGDGD